MELLNLMLIASALHSSGPEVPPVVLKSRIIEASIFKSGIVMVTREVMVPSGDGRYSLDTVPEASDGSFWYSSPDGIVVTDIETVLRTSEEKVKVTAQTVGDYLAANVGQHVRLSYKTYTYGCTLTKEVIEQVEGIVNGPPRAQTNTVPIKLTNGHLRNIALNNIEDIDTTGLKSELSRSFTVPKLSIHFRARTDKPVKLDFVTLETGAAWVGSYLVKLKQNGAATVEGKAQIALGQLSFDETNIRAMAGQPYMVANNRFDLNSGVGSLSSYLEGNQAQFLAYHSGNLDPFQLLPEYATEASQAEQWVKGFDSGSAQYDAYSYGGGRGGGGMGGGVFGSLPIASGNTSSGQSSISRIRELASQATTDRLESLYAYPLGKVTLQSGDRLSRLLFSQSSSYENIYRWSTEVNNSTAQVKSVLRVHNTGTVPWTGGLVFVTKDDSPLAQMDMPFTSAGKTADLELANVQDILAKKEETEISRDTIPMPGRPKVMLQRALNEVHLSVESSRLEAANVEITLMVPGDVVDANGGKVEKLLTRPDSWNRNSRITWTLTLSPGDKREFRLQYRHVG